MPAPLIVLEFTRADQAGDPYAFSFAPQEYIIRNAQGGVRTGTFPWSEGVLRELSALRGPARGDEVEQRLGERLRDFLGAAWETCEREILDAVHAGAGVTVTLRSSAAELYALPWELLRLRSTGQPLGGVPGLVISYEWPETRTTPARASGRVGRVLIAWSAAGGEVPAEEHVAAIRGALSEREGAFSRDRDVVANASYGAIDDALDRAAREGPPIDVLHLLCHGASAGESYGLALDADEHARGSEGLAVVDPARLQQLLAPHLGMVRLLVIAACDSGDAGAPANLLGSAAQMSHRAGAEAVIASRFPLSAAGSTREREFVARGAGHEYQLVVALERGQRLELTLLVRALTKMGTKVELALLDADKVRVASVSAATLDREHWHRKTKQFTASASGSYTLRVSLDSDYERHPGRYRFKLTTLAEQG